MTSIVGVLCKDGVVIGTDSSTTLAAGQFVTIEQPTEKLDIIGESIIVAGTGAVGLGQRFCSIVRKNRVAHDFSKISALDIAKGFCKATLDDFHSTYVQMGQYGALVAFPSLDGPALCEFAVRDFQPELKNERFWYCSMGSAQPITDPFLGFIRDVFWRDGRPNISDGIFAITWTLDHAVSVNPGGVNGPVRIAVLTREQGGQFHARLLDENDLLEHRQNIEEVKQSMRNISMKYQVGSPIENPDIPRP